MASSDSPARQVTVVDVYNLASNIGKDFESLIDKFGTHTVTSLMPKVISALELLEAFASRNERENEEIISLQSTIERLEVEKEEKKEGKQKFEKEVELLEDNYRTEIKQLWEMVQRLQEENKRLNSSLQQKEQMSPTYAIKEEDITMMMSLREMVDQQRDQMKAVNKENSDRQLEAESLHQQVEKLQRVNKELARRNKAIQNQSRALVEEKADLISLLQDRDHALEQLKLKLGETEKARKDLEQDKVEETSVDPDNVPRFTLAELREVLQEKNQLKARVMELEEELSQLRPAATPSPQPSDKTEEEVLVYGPINREPEEKLNPWKCRKEAGVRKFFSTLWRRSIRGNDHLTSNGQTASPPSIGRSTAVADQRRDTYPLSVSFVRGNDASPCSSDGGAEDRVSYDSVFSFNLGLDF